MEKNTFNKYNRYRDVQEVLQQPSNLIIRLGTVFIFLLVVCAIIILSKIEITQDIRSTILIKSSNSFKNHFYGISNIEQKSINKIKLNQPVTILLDYYPHSEFGQLNGYISHISDTINGDKSISVLLTFSELKTSKNKRINLLNNMSGVLVIPTGKKHIIQFFK